MDFLLLLSGMEYKTLNANNVEILKSAFAAQDETIKLLKSANAVLDENAALLRCRAEQLVAENAALREANDALHQKLPPLVEYAPSQAAREVLAVFAERDATQINDKRDMSSIALPRETIEMAIEELCSANVVELASLGEFGCWFTLTGYGKEFLGRRAPIRPRRAAAPPRASLESLPIANAGASCNPSVG